MRTHWLTIAKLAIIASVAAPRSASAQVVDSTTLRPTDVVVTIANDNPRYDGVYKASGMSRICGKLDMMMPHRANSFNVEFPDDEPNLAVPSVQFDADTLSPGDSTKSFSLSVASARRAGTPLLFMWFGPKKNPSTASRELRSAPRPQAGTPSRSSGSPPRGPR